MNSFLTYWKMVMESMKNKTWFLHSFNEFIFTKQNFFIEK